MCTRPAIIRNPNYNRTTYATQFGKIVDVPMYLTISKEFVEVPCGKCAECRATYYNSVLQRAIVEARTSYMYFVTLTYDNKHLPNLTLPTGETIYYADYSDIQRLFKRIRNLNILDRDFRYLCAVEYGDSYSRPHFHLLVFVSKTSEDTKTTPYYIESLLYDNLKKYFAVNVGSLRCPIYEPLFTYNYKVTPKGIKTNYFVKYVEPDTDISIYDVNQSDNYVKTIRYLIGYVNKGSAFDITVQQYLDNIDDPLLRSRLEIILRSKFRFSKGFGCGFDTSGKKVYLPRISSRTALNTLIYTDFINSLPSTFGDLSDTMPDLVNDLSKFIAKNVYMNYSSLKDCIKDMSVNDYLSHCLLIRYFPHYFSKLYHEYYHSSQLDTPKISYFFRKKPYKYHKSFIHSFDIEQSETYNYLRRGVEMGIAHRVPFIAFRTTNGYTALCKFYRDRVTTIDDYIYLYKVLNVKNYDEWQELFLRQYSTTKANISNSNRFTHSVSENIIFKKQKKYLDLPRSLKGVTLYSRVIG